MNGPGHAVSAGRRRAVGAIVGAACLLTLLNCLKPLHIDDPFIHRIAQRIVEHPLDPYGFDIFWLQWPQPVYEELTPPVLPYGWSIPLALFGEHPLAWKLSLLPVALLLCASLHALGRRFAPSLAVPVVALVALSPAFLPAQNLMQDVPAVALGLTALALYLAAADRNSWALAVGAGLVAGLATQTKYTAVSMLACIVLWGLLRRSRLTAVLAAGTALAVFAGWEMYTTATYGQGMFLGQVRHGLYWFSRLEMVIPLLKLLGATMPAVMLLALGGLGLPGMALRTATVLTMLGYAALCWFDVGAALHLLLGLLLAAATAAAAARLLTRAGRAYRQRSEADVFLVCWLLVEVAVYFATSPFPAVRRVMGIAVVVALIAARVAAERLARRPRSVPWGWPVSAGIALGLVFFAVDRAEAVAQRDAVSGAEATIRVIDPEPRVWFVGHWGFQHHAELAGWRPVVPDVSELLPGDWLVVPHPVHQQEIRLDRADTETATILEIGHFPPLTTGYGYYGGDEPLGHLDGSRLRTTILRVRRPWVPLSAWSPAQLEQWAASAGGRTAAAALPALVRALDEASSHGRAAAARGLGHLGERAAPALPALVTALADEYAEVRREAAAALGAVGPAAGAARAALTRAATDPDPTVRAAAVAALARVAPAN